MNAIIKEKEREIMRIEPFGERVAIRVLESEETTESGLIIANPNKLSSNRGEVVALGNEVKDFFKNYSKKTCVLLNFSLSVEDIALTRLDTLKERYKSDIKDYINDVLYYYKENEIKSKLSYILSHL